MQRSPSIPHCGAFARPLPCLALLALLTASTTAAAIPGTWAETGSLHTRRGQPAAGAIGGRIYAVGGVAGGGDFARLIEVYNPRTGLWTERGPLPDPDGDVFSAHGTVGGRLYVIGGVQPTANQQYAPTTDTWTMKQDAPVPLLGLASTTVGGKVYGLGPDAALKYDALVYDPSADSWGRIADPPAPGISSCAAAAGGRVYLMGGSWDDPALASVFEYDPATDSWAVKRDMPTARRRFGCVGPVG